MKNNEILISAKFEGNGVSEELSFLVLKDITLKSLIQAVYYGLKKLDGHEKTFDFDGGISNADRSHGCSGFCGHMEI